MTPSQGASNISLSPNQQIQVMLYLFGHSGLIKVKILRYFLLQKIN